MMRKTLVWFLLLLGLVVFSFAPVQIANAQSPGDCDAYARNETKRSTGSVLGGAVRSGAGGALFGAIVGNKKSAKKGAALGAVVGGIKRAVGKNKAHQRAYDDCMAGRVQW